MKNLLAKIDKNKEKIIALKELKTSEKRPFTLNLCLTAVLANYASKRLLKPVEFLYCNLIPAEFYLFIPFQKLKVMEKRVETYYKKQRENNPNASDCKTC